MRALAHNADAASDGVTLEPSINAAPWLRIDGCGSVRPEYARALMPTGDDAVQSCPIAV